MIKVDLQNNVMPFFKMVLFYDECHNNSFWKVLYRRLKFCDIFQDNSFKENVQQDIGQIQTASTFQSFNIKRNRNFFSITFNWIRQISFILKTLNKLFFNISQLKYLKWQKLEILVNSKTTFPYNLIITEAKISNILFALTFLNWYQLLLSTFQ